MKIRLMAGLLVLGLGRLMAADNSKEPGEKLHVDFNVPLWPDGKVPGAVGDWSVDKPYLTAVLPQQGNVYRRTIQKLERPTGSPHRARSSKRQAGDIASCCAVKCFARWIFG